MLGAVIRDIIRSVFEHSNMKGSYHTKFLIDLPDKYKRNICYLIGCNNQYWVLTFLCPCGCGDKIYLNLLKDNQPFWRINFDVNTISVYPSIWKTGGCRSHFFITNNRIIWA
jgi:hypothetical protein